MVNQKNYPPDTTIRRNCPQETISGADKIRTRLQVRSGLNTRV